MNSNYLFLTIGTIAFLILCLIVSFILMLKVTKNINDAQLRSEYRGMSFGLTFLGIFCIWLMWFTIFMNHINTSNTQNDKLEFNYLNK